MYGILTHMYPPNGLEILVYTAHMEHIFAQVPIVSSQHFSSPSHWTVAQMSKGPEFPAMGFAKLPDLRTLKPRVPGSESMDFPDCEAWEGAIF